MERVCKCWLFSNFTIQISRYITWVIHTWSVVGRWGFWSDDSSLGILFVQAVEGRVQREAAPECFGLLALTGTTRRLGHLHWDRNQPPVLQCHNVQCLRQCIRTDKGTILTNVFLNKNVGWISHIDCYRVIMDKGNCEYVPVRIESSSLSDPTWRAIVMADSRSPWADLRFLAKHSMLQTNKIHFQSIQLRKSRNTWCGG